MQIVVSGKQVDIGEKLREHAEKRLTDGISKYLDRVNSVMAVVSREAHQFRVDINANTGTHSGLVIKGRGESEDAYAAFDMAADKIEKQLRRYKRRLTDHHKAEGIEQTRVAGTKYVLSGLDAPEASTEDAPVIIAEKPTDIETLTVSAAVMKMDLADLPALLFTNSASGRLNVVYRRHDGNISWVDPGVAGKEKAA